MAQQTPLFRNLTFAATAGKYKDSSKHGDTSLMTSLHLDQQRNALACSFVVQRHQQKP